MILEGFSDLNDSIILFCDSLKMFVLEGNGKILKTSLVVLFQTLEVSNAFKCNKDMAKSQCCLVVPD